MRVFVSCPLPRLMVLIIWHDLIKQKRQKRAGEKDSQLARITGDTFFPKTVGNKWLSTAKMLGSLNSCLPLPHVLHFKEQ